MTDADREEIKTIVNKLADFFKDEPIKVAWWLMTENPNLGGAAPFQMIAVGRGWKLLKFIEAAEYMNEEPKR